MRRTFAAAVLMTLTAPLFAADPAKDFYFQKGDRVLFIGDSITEQYQYSTYIELYLTTRFPDWNLQFLNAGIGGDTATGGANRFANHVLAEKPTAITIDFGMNDGGYGAFNPASAANFAAKTTAMVEMAKKAGIRVALISPNAVEVRNNPGLKTYLETQKQFYAPLKDIAAKNELTFVDQYAVTRAVLDKIAADKAAVKPFPDAVHTNEAGGLLMAHSILVGLHAPALVSDLTLDAASKEAKTRGCTIKEVAGGPDGVTFERNDAALPLPILKGWRDLLPYVDDLKNLNYYGLKVTGLAGDKYELSIDGKAVGMYTAKDLAAGVNLGNLASGPLFEQGAKVLQAINKKNEVVHKRFREVVMANKPEADKADELKKRKDTIDAQQAEVYKLAQPTTHRFELKAAKP